MVERIWVFLCFLLYLLNLHLFEHFESGKFDSACRVESLSLLVCNMLQLGFILFRLLPLEFSKLIAAFNCLLHFLTNIFIQFCLLLLPPFKIISHSGCSRYIAFAIHEDICKSRCVTKAMYLQKPQGLIIGNGGSI